MKKLLLLALSATFVLSSCKKDEEDPDLGEAISGTYSMSSYIVGGKASSGDLSNNKIRVTRIDDTHAKIVIDYIDENEDDFEVDNASISADGDNFKFDQTYSNAEASGTVVGNEITLEVDYTDPVKSDLITKASK